MFGVFSVSYTSARLRHFGSKRKQLGELKVVEFVVVYKYLASSSEERQSKASKR